MYLEPYLEVESSAGMTCSVEQSESNTAINATTKKNSNSKTLLVGHGTAQVGLYLAVEATQMWGNLGNCRGGRTIRPREKFSAWESVKGIEAKKRVRLRLEMESGEVSERKRSRHWPPSQTQHCLLLVQEEAPVSVEDYKSSLQ